MYIINLGGKKWRTKMGNLEFPIAPRSDYGELLVLHKV